MRKHLRLLLMALFVGHAGLAISLAQSIAVPKINTVFPMGGQAGTTFEVTIVGSDLGTAEGLHFSFPGVKVEVEAKQEVKLDPAQKKGKGMVAGPATGYKFKVTLPANAPLGIHDVRFVGSGGVSNPRAFVVSDQAEVVEKEPNDNIPPKAQVVELNTTVNAVIGAPTDVDYYQFKAQKGERVVVSCLSSSIDSRLPAFVQVYGPANRYFGSNKNYNGNDALFDVIIPEDGDYYVRVSSFSYTQGGADYFYRLSLTTAPWIDAVVPSMVEAGKTGKVTVLGRNLPGGKLDPELKVDGRPLERLDVDVTAPKDALAVGRLTFTGAVSPAMGTLNGFDLRLKNKAGSSNPFLMTIATAPVVVEKEPNDSGEKATTVPVPGEIFGQIGKANDNDHFRFKVKKGEVLLIDALSERLGGGMDLRFAIHYPNGDRYIEQDESAEITANQFYTRNEDPPTYRFKAPSDGDYTLVVSAKDGSINYGPRCYYTVRIMPEQPDFTIVAMPQGNQNQDSAVIGQDGNYAYTAFIFRTGGVGDITVTGENLPAGITVKPQIMAAGAKSSAIGVSVAPGAPPFAGGLKLVGTAVVDGKKIVREVRSATISWPVVQPNSPTITRLDRELAFAVRDKSVYRLETSDKLTVGLGEQIKIPVKFALLKPDFKGSVQVTAAVIPVGLTVPTPLTLQADKNSGNVVLDPKGQVGVQPGNYTIILKASTQPVTGKPPIKPPGPDNITQFSAPISLTIAPKQLGKLTIAIQNGKVTAGKTLEVPVKMARLYNFEGPIKIELLQGKGVNAKEVVLTGPDEDAKLIVEADNGVAGIQNLMVRATAMFNDLPIVHEAKLTVTVTK